MLNSNKYNDWSLTDHKDREYATEAEKRFFGAVDNPKPATKELKETYRAYGKYLKTTA